MMTWNSIFFHSPSSFLMESIVSMHDYVMMFLISILILVVLNMLSTFLIKYFNMEFFENHQLEIIWTLVPFILLMLIVFPSLLTLYLLDSCFFCGMSINVMGHQWYWSYYYKDLNMDTIDSYMLPNETNIMRLLDVDNRLVVPCLLPVRLMLSSSDVLHSWALSSLGLKMDAVPGRINQFCFTFKRSGVFFGQCSEICGANHSFMPIVVESISFKDYLTLMSY